VAAWLRGGGPDLRVSVDLSLRHLARSRVVEDVAEVLATAGIAARHLVLEVSDLSLVEDPVALAHLDRVRELGVFVVLEDFGLGHSSVRRLERLPLDAVKLDASFVRRPGSAAGDRLTSLMVQGAQNFGLLAHAKGLDGPGEVAFARGLDCDRGQGRCFGEPVEGAEVARQLAALDPVVSSRS